MALIINGTTGVTFNDNSLQGAAAAKIGANTDITSLAGVATINGAPGLHLNDIINGDFRIAQAGTSFAAAANVAYDLDGWLNAKASGAIAAQI